MLAVLSLLPRQAGRRKLPSTSAQADPKKLYLPNPLAALARLAEEGEGQEEKCNEALWLWSDSIPARAVGTERAWRPIRVRGREPGRRRASAAGIPAAQSGSQASGAGRRRSGDP